MKKEKKLRNKTKKLNWKLGDLEINSPQWMRLVVELANKIDEVIKEINNLCPKKE